MRLITAGGGSGTNGKYFEHFSKSLPRRGVENDAVYTIPPRGDGHYSRKLHVHNAWEESFGKSGRLRARKNLIF
jgi:hypothetical protein